MASYTFELFASYNKKAGLRLKNANARMFGLDISMEFNEEDGHWRVTMDLPDGIYHYQYKVVTKSWFEPEPESALPEYNNDETKTSEENEQIQTDFRNEHDKLVEEVKERNKKREEEITFTEVWYTFVDPYATEVDECGSDDSFRSVGVLIFKNGRKIVDEYEWKYDNHVPLVPNEKLIIYELHVGDFEDKFTNITAKMDYFVQLSITADKRNKKTQALVLDTPNWGELKNVVDASRRGYKTITDVVNYQSNHDRDCLLVDLGKENQICDEEAFRRVRMALAIQATSFGLMMIWMDQDDNSNAINKEQLQFYKDVIHIRKSNSALRSPNLEPIFEQIDDQIMAWHRWNTVIDDNQKQKTHIVTVYNWSSSKTYESYKVLNMPRNGR
ncbi:unnamed protein product [Rotaria sp. Silwood2]|nr:unnamed protein product [Rotaria sp. Silwood2]CAF4380952.1 unnamed protein product [Rotaria sp. Silwood2]